MVKVTESNMMEKEVNNWPAVENMFIVKDMVEEFCILNDAWLFCHFCHMRPSGEFPICGSWLGPY